MKMRKLCTGILSIVLIFAFAVNVSAASHNSGDVSDNVVIQPEDTITFTDKTISAKFTALWGVRVIFEDYNHTEIKNVVVPVGDNAPGTSSAPEDPSRDGYTFTDWQRTDGKGGTATLNDDGTVTNITGPGAIIFTAVYTKNTPTPPSKPTEIYDNVPKTGDTSNITLWIAAMCISGIGLVFIRRKLQCK